MAAGSRDAQGVATSDLDRQILAILEEGDSARAATVALRALGPEVFGFLCGVVGAQDAEEVFSSFSMRLWRSLATFEGRCSVRTWSYVLARHEIGRHRRGGRRHEVGRLPISELEDVLAAARTSTQSALGSEKARSLAKLREDLSVEDRTLLVLRIDRKLAWEDIALAFAESPETFGEADRKRESARLRKRFQLVKEKLVVRARALQGGKGEKQ